MKKMAFITTLMMLVLVYVGAAGADEAKIEQLINNYETALNEKNISSLRSIYYKEYMEVSFDERNKMYLSSSEGDKVFKGIEKLFRILKLHKVSNTQIIVNRNIAYVNCEESQVLTTVKKPLTYKTMLTCIKVGGRWHIAMQASQAI